MNMPGGKEYGPFEEDRKYTSYGRNNSYWSNLEQQVKEGKVSSERINEASKRIIATMYQMNQMEDFPEVNILKKTNTTERKALQRKAATESQVLLKNDGILPLNISNLKTIAVVGNDAFERDCIPSMLPQCLNDTNEVINGHIPLGFGSGVTNFEYLVTPFDGIKNYAEKHNVEVKSSGKMNYIDEDRKLKNGTIYKINVTALEDIEGGIEAANNSDVVIVFVKASSGEEFVVLKEAIGDRRDLDVWYGGNELINNIAEVNDNVIVVINAPATVNLPWKDKVRAIIFSGFPGAESGNAIADILFGEVNPSGHLPFVWAKDEEYCAQINALENLTVINET
jgi:beta-glucosidase